MTLSTLINTLLRRAAALILPGVAALAVLSAAAPAAPSGEVTVSMTAETELEAIRYALAEAVSRTQGAEVSVGGELHPELSEVVRRLELKFDPRGGEEFHVRNVSHGYVRSYEVLETTRGTEGVTVSVRANVLGYDPNNPRPGSRTSVLVQGFRLAAGAVQLDKPATGQTQLQEDLRRDLTRRLVRSNKFSVLTETNVGQEVTSAIGKSSSTPASVREELRVRLGADYIVRGVIDRVYIHSDSRTIKLTGHTNVTKVAEVSASLELMRVETGAIERTIPYAEAYRWDGAELAREPAFQDDAVVARMMVEEAAAQLAKRLVRETFPLRVIEIESKGSEGPVFFLNAGSAVYGIGDTFELVQQGRELRDPDSGEVLGHRETVVALLRLVRQDEKLSQAVLLEPTPEQAEWARSAGDDLSGLHCRPLARPTER